MTSWASLLESGLKLIFHWKAQSLIFFKLLFSPFAEVVMPCVTENRDVWGLLIRIQNKFKAHLKQTVLVSMDSNKSKTSPNVANKFMTWLYCS